MAGNSGLLPNYAPGTEITLAVDKADEYFPKHIKLTVVREITATMSPVLEVAYTDDSGTAPKRAALKLFDRRLGSTMRRVLTPVEPRMELKLPATTRAEKAYRRYVRRGKASKLWEEIDANNKQTATSKMPRDYWKPRNVGDARYEAALQHQCLLFFKKEVAVYDKLAHIQGDCIPRMLAQVHLASAQSSDTKSKVDSKIENVAEVHFERMKQQADGKGDDESDDIIPANDFKADSRSSPLQSPISSAPSTTSSRVPSSSFSVDDIETDNSSHSHSNASSRTACTPSIRATSPTFNDNGIESKKENTATSGRSCSSSSSVNNEMESQVVHKIQGEAEDKINHNLEDTAEEKYEDSPFSRVNGVLLEYVSGTPLSDFVDSPPPVHGAQWKSILQDVVNTAEKINRAGVLMTDCRSGNVLLRTDDLQPVFVDFAQAKIGDFDDEEARFGNTLYFFDNPFHVVCHLVNPCARKGGEKIQLTYPRFDDLAQDDDADWGVDLSYSGASTPSFDSKASTPELRDSSA